MNIAILSDLHIEQYKDQGKTLIKSIDPTGVDVLVLAGDIFATISEEAHLELLKLICDRYPHVIYAYGNHEYYGNDVYAIQDRTNHMNGALSNLHILDDANEITINGQRFLVGTMWFMDLPENILYKRNIRDFHYIRRFEPWVYERNERFEENLTEKLTSNDIIVTHHLPSERSVDSIFKGSSLNRFFLHDIEWLIQERKPKMAIHGHGHIPMDYKIGNTRVISNPKGYLGECYLNRKQFNPNLRIEV